MGHQITFRTGIPSFAQFLGMDVSKYTLSTYVHGEHRTRRRGTNQYELVRTSY